MKLIAPVKFEPARACKKDSKVKSRTAGRAGIRNPWFGKDNGFLKRRKGQQLIYSTGTGNG
ncbi:MAG: hypothetical protein ACHQHN_05420 [Sphingobacteriales bacterium]